MRELFLGVLTLSLCLTAMGCQSGPAQAEAANPQHLIEPLDAQRIGYRSRWITSLNMPDKYSVEHATLLGDMLIIVEKGTNLTTAISVRNGELLWAEVVADPSEKLYPPIRFDDQIVMSTSHKVYLLDAVDGELKQLQELEWVVDNGAALVDSFAVFGGINGRLFAHDLRSAQTRWEYLLTDQIIVKPARSAPHYVFGADSRGYFVMLDGRTSEMLWNGRTFGRISAQPLVSQLSVIVPSEDHSVYALNRIDGRDRWVYRSSAPVKRDPILIGKVVYIHDPAVGLVALDDVAGGKLLWTVKEPIVPVRQSDNNLVAHTRDHVVIVDADKGNVMHRVETIAPLHTVLAGPDESLIMISEQGRIVRLDLD